MLVVILALLCTKLGRPYFSWKLTTSEAHYVTASFVYQTKTRALFKNDVGKISEHALLGNDTSHTDHTNMVQELNTAPIGFTALHIKAIRLKLCFPGPRR